MVAEDNKTELQELIDGPKKFYQESSKNDLSWANQTFGSIGSQLILIAGIFIAFSSVIMAGSSKGDNSLKVILFSILLFLSLSIIFGIIQFFIDHSFYRKWSIMKKSLADKIGGSIKTWGEFNAANDEMNSSMSFESPVWSRWTQTALITVAIILILVFAGISLL